MHSLSLTMLSSVVIFIHLHILVTSSITTPYTYGNFHCSPYKRDNTTNNTDAYGNYINSPHTTHNSLHIHMLMLFINHPYTIALLNPKYSKYSYTVRSSTKIIRENYHENLTNRFGSCQAMFVIIDPRWRILHPVTAN